MINYYFIKGCFFIIFFLNNKINNNRLKFKTLKSNFKKNNIQQYIEAFTFVVFLEKEKRERERKKEQIIVIIYLKINQEQLYIFI